MQNIGSCIATIALNLKKHGTMHWKRDAGGTAHQNPCPLAGVGFNALVRATRADDYHRHTLTRKEALKNRINHQYISFTIPNFGRVIAMYLDDIVLAMQFVPVTYLSDEGLRQALQGFERALIDFESDGFIKTKFDVVRREFLDALDNCVGEDLIRRYA